MSGPVCVYWLGRRCRLPYRCCCRSMMAPPFFSPAQRRDERPIEIVEIHRGSFKLLFSLDSGVIILFAIPRKIFGSGGNGIGASALEGDVVDSRHQLSWSCSHQPIRFIRDPFHRIKIVFNLRTQQVCDI